VKIVAPFTVDHPPTVRALNELGPGFEVERWHMRRPDDYLALMEYQWSLRETFVNVEHDVEFSWSQMFTTATCAQPWCWHPYLFVTEPQSPNLGLTKISFELIAATPNIWTDFRDSSEVRRRRWQRQPTWSMLDDWLAHYRTDYIEPHMHRSAVVNARPEGVERMPDDSMAGFLHG
jgi:hypothetical protein